MLCASGCGARARHVCEACGTPYCSPVCQNAAWPAHRETCGATSDDGDADVDDAAVGDLGDAFVGLAVKNPLRRKRAPLLSAATQRIADAAVPLFRRLAALKPCDIDATLAPRLKIEDTYEAPTHDELEQLLAIDAAPRAPISKSDANLARSLVLKADAKRGAATGGQAAAPPDLYGAAVLFAFMARTLRTDVERAEARRIVRALRLLAGVTDEQARALALQFERARLMCNHCAGGVCDKTGDPPWCKNAPRPTCPNGNLRARRQPPPKTIGGESDSDSSSADDDAGADADANDSTLETMSTKTTSTGAATAASARDKRSEVVGAYVALIETDTLNDLNADPVGDEAEIAEFEMIEDTPLDRAIAIGVHVALHGDEANMAAIDPEAAKQFMAMELSERKLEAALPPKIVEDFVRAQRALVGAVHAWLVSDAGLKTYETLAEAANARAAKNKRKR